MMIEDGIFNTKGKFARLSNDKNFVNENLMLKSAGVFRDWPEDRVAYINDNFICYINEEDHLKLKINGKIGDKDNLSGMILRYFEFLEKMEKNVNFCVHNNLGYLTTLPSNIGTGTYFKLKIKINPNKATHVEIIKKMEENSKDILFEIKKISKEDEIEKFILEIETKNPFYSFSTLLVDILGIKEHFK
jgi:hypothetical protein